jgi:predicted dehydrogenase
VSAPLAVGLVGAGPWARFVHAPMIASHAGTTLAGVWARRLESAEDVAKANGATACASFDELLARCDVVAFAVPPDVQAALAIQAAAAGKALLLEKPIALDLGSAHQLVDAVDAAGVPTMVNLTWRYAASVRAFLDAVAATDPIGGCGRFISGALLGGVASASEQPHAGELRAKRAPAIRPGMFATPWRLEHGALMDLGPHVIDLLDAALGPVVGVRAHGDPGRWVGLLLEHQSGVASEASLAAHSNVDPFRAGVEIYSAEGVNELDAATAVSPATLVTVVDELIETVGGGSPNGLDVHRGLHLQRVLEDAFSQLR